MPVSKSSRPRSPKPAKKAPATVGPPRSVSQAELAGVLEQNESLNRRMAEIRDRINGGAKIEPGELSAKAEKDHDDDGATRSLSALGLDIMPKAELIDRDAWIKENRTLAAMESDSATGLPVFSGDLASARSRFQDVSSVFLRTAAAEDLNRISFQLSGGLGVDYGLIDLHEQVRAEISDDRRALDARRQLRICSKPVKGARNVHI